MRACPKPEPRRKVKARARREEQAVIDRVREYVFRRDRTCRMGGEYALGWCDGPLDWAHMTVKRRSKTRGLPPEDRHTTEDSLCLCRRHHDAYDHGQLLIVPVTSQGADSYLIFHSRLSNVLYLEVRGGIVVISTSHARAAAALMATLEILDASDETEGHGSTGDCAR